MCRSWFKYEPQRRSKLEQNVVADRSDTKMLRGLVRNETSVKRLFLAGLLLSIIPFLILTFFTHPAYDDYCWACHVLQRGYVATQKTLYDTFIGRYFSTALVTSSPLTFGSFAGYKAVTLLTIVLTFVSIYCFADAFLESNTALIDKLIAATFLTALFGNQTPDVTEAFFWVTGNIVYQLGGILTLFFFALVIRSADKSKGVGFLSFLLSCLLIAAIVGTNETSMLVLALLVFAITIKSWMAKSDRRWRWLVFSLVTIGCALIVIVAPGNAVRSAFFPNRRRFFFSLGMSLGQEVRFLLTWLSNVPFVLATILFIPIAARRSPKIVPLRRLRIHPAISSLLLIMIVFLGLFPPYWGMGMLGQHRTVNTVYFLFLIGWFVNVIIWVNYLRERHKLTIESLPKYVYIIGVPLLLFGLLSTNNTRTAIADLVSLRAYRYDVEMKKRYAQFGQCAREGHAEDCRRLTISDLPTSITSPYFEEDTDCERKFWNLRAPSESK